MGLADLGSLVQIYAQFFQYIGIVSSVRVNWPVSWNQVLQFASFLKLDFSIEFPNVSIPRVDSRAQYVILANVLPLVLAILLLIFFKSLKVVLWYVLLLSSIGLLIAGVVTKFVLRNGLTDTTLSDSFIIAGGSVLALMILLFLIVWCVEKRQKAKVHALKEKQRRKAEGNESSSEDSSENEDVEIDERFDSQPNLESIVKNRYKEKGFWIQFRNFLVGSAFVFLAILLLNFVTIEQIFGSYLPPSVYAIQRMTGDIGFGVGIALLVIGSLLLLNFSLNLFSSGRKFTTDLNNFLKMNVLMIVLLVLTLTYIPVTSSILTMVNCDNKLCEAGKSFYEDIPDMSVQGIGSSFLKKSSNATASYCSKCSFLNSCNITSSLCPASYDYRLIEDMRFSCSSEIFLFYTPGAALMILSYTFGVPYLFYNIISTSIKYLQKMPILTTDEEARWILAVNYTANSCKSLYGMFEYRWRYYNLILLLQKLLVVTVYIFARDIPIVLASLLGFIQTYFALMAIKSQPYINRIEDVTATVCTSISALNAILAFLVALRHYNSSLFPYELPDWLIIPVALFNTLVPVLVTTIATLMSFYRGDSNVRKLKEAEKKQLESKAKADMQRIRNTASLGRADLEIVDLDDDDYNYGMEAKNHKKAQVKGKISTEEKEVKRMAYAIDAELNKVNLKIIVNFFLFLGVSGFLSLSLIICGFLIKSQSGQYTGPFNGDSKPAMSRVAAFEFAGYEDWNSFTRNCCCSNHTQADKPVELWKCINNGGSFNRARFKIRQRQLGNIDGTLVRPFCSLSFNESLICQKPIYDANINSSYYVVGPCPGVTLHSDILTFLW